MLSRRLRRRKGRTRSPFVSRMLNESKTALKRGEMMKVIYLWSLMGVISRLNSTYCTRRRKRCLQWRFIALHRFDFDGYLRRVVVLERITDCQSIRKRAFLFVTYLQFSNEVETFPFPCSCFRLERTQKNNNRRRCICASKAENAGIIAKAI
jgi:hypothetical protein